MEHLEFTVHGMTCGSCVARVTRALESLPGVEHANVDLRTGRGSVSGELPSKELLRSAVQAAGYEVDMIPVSSPGAENEPTPTTPKRNASVGGCGSNSPGKAGGCCCH